MRRGGHLGASSVATFSIRPAETLGTVPQGLLREHITSADLDAWLTEHEHDGQCEIIDDRDGLPACGHDTGLAGGAAGCDCGRATCGVRRGGHLGPWLVAVGGSPQARERWPLRTYATKGAARRRLKRIRQARDLEVETVWIVPA